MLYRWVQFIGCVVLLVAAVGGAWLSALNSVVPPYDAARTRRALAEARAHWSRLEQVAMDPRRNGYLHVSHLVANPWCLSPVPEVEYRQGRAVVGTINPYRYMNSPTRVVWSAIAAEEKQLLAVRRYEEFLDLNLFGEQHFHAYATLISDRLATSALHRFSWRQPDEAIERLLLADRLIRHSRQGVHNTEMMDGHTALRCLMAVLHRMDEHKVPGRRALYRKVYRELSTATHPNDLEETDWHYLKMLRDIDDRAKHLEGIYGALDRRILARDRRLVLACYLRAREAARLPYRSAWPRRQSDPLQRHYGKWGFPFYVDSGLVQRKIVEYPVLCYSTWFKASRRAACVIAAVYLYKADHGEPPAYLSQLIPRYMSALPDDPFARHGPFRYRRTGGDFLLYSIGSDMHDGAAVREANEPRDRGDIVFTQWR